MTTLHAFGCSITQGFALPDVVQPIRDQQGRVLTDRDIDRLGIEVNWEDIHIYEPSQYAWPAVLAHRMGWSVINSARRGACFQQIARQCVVATDNIQTGDVAIVMWTYLSRISLQWPARTTVPFCNVVDPTQGWHTRILGFNKFFGLSGRRDLARDRSLHRFIENAVETTYLDPLSIYDRYYNSMILQVTVDGLLKSRGARVIHLSVEPDTAVKQLELARQDLPDTVRDPYTLPHPRSWYKISVDHHSCEVIHDTRIPPAENDMHPSVQHHSNFADHLVAEYFSEQP